MTTRVTHGMSDAPINVRAAGAVGDGVADDHDAFTRALAAAAGKTLLIPPGVYLLSKAIAVPAATTVVGAGYGTVLKPSAQAINVVELNDDCTVRDFRIEMIDGGTPGMEVQNGVYAAGRKRVIVESLWIKNAVNCSGIQFRNTTDSAIRNNIVWGGYYDGQTPGQQATVADIIFYSDTGGGRCVIAGNRCLSNNSQGIFVNSLGYDTDCAITGNVCVTMSHTGTWQEASNGGNRRHGILVAYTGNNASRMAVTGNVCRNTRVTGICVQSAGGGTGQNVAITGNVCSLNGQSTTEPLAGGIWIAVNGGETIAGNVVANFAGTSGNGGIVISASTVGGVAGASVTGNTVHGSAGIGILLTNRAREIRVSGNVLNSNAGSDIVVSQTAGDTGLGGHQIIGNSCLRDNHEAPAIRVDLQSGARRAMINTNHIRGNSKTTASATNVGVEIAGVAAPVTCTDNLIELFYYGVNFSSLLSASTRYIDTVHVDRNVFRDCTQAIGIASGTSATATIGFDGNVFLSCTAKIGLGTNSTGYAAGYVARRLDGAYEIRASAAPTAGTWAVGDRAVNSAPTSGQPKAWVCTVAGTPGTWTSEGNL